MDRFSEIFSIKTESLIFSAALKVFPTLSHTRNFVSRWTIPDFEPEMTRFVSKIENTGVLPAEDISNIRNALEEYYLIAKVTPGVILLLRGTFLFYIDEIEMMEIIKIDDKRLHTIWGDLYKIVILNISLNPTEWLSSTPKSCLEWKEEYSKYGIQKKTFLSFVAFVQDTL
jgi:hypothetical protein